MMLLLSVGIQPAASATHSSNLPALAAKSFQSQFSPVQIPLKSRPKICASYSSQTLASSISNGDKIEATEKLGVVVKPMERPRLVLKFIWMEKNIGIAIDQVVIPAGGHGTIPLSPYYFWPRKDAWEELKVMLESKPWIPNKHKVILLNQATDIINLWQQSAGELD